MKNGFVLAALLFSGRALELGAALKALGAFASFCLLASAVYVLNDVVDRASDRAHPTKRFRPVASGEVSTPAAVIGGSALLLLATWIAFSVSPGVGQIALLYVGLNVAYSLVLKRVVLLDVFSIAAFFVLRLLAGAAAIDVVPSVWLLLCGGLLALYLGFAKRRHEIVLLGDDAMDHRAVLSEYSVAFLDQLSGVILAVTIVCYIMYTFESETARLVGGHRLTYSSVFVLYGVFRYLHLAHSRADGNPADTLLSDRSLLITVILWAAYCATVLYGLPPGGMP